MQPTATGFKRDGFPNRLAGNTPKLLLSGAIDSTKSLIETLNEESDTIETKRLRDCLWLYVDWFTGMSIECIFDEEVQEYILIGQLKIRSPLDRNLLQAWFSSLCNTLKGREGEDKIVRGLECALLCLDREIFKKDPEPLLRLSKSLLTKLNPQETTFTEATYDKHRATLLAVHQSFHLIQEVSPKLLNTKIENGVYQDFRKSLRNIKEDQDHYPFVFHVKLIKQSLQRLEREGKMPLLMGALNRLCRGTWGALCIAQGIRAAIVLEFGHDSFEAGWYHLQKATTRQRIKKTECYDWIHQLNRMVLNVFDDPEVINEFLEDFDDLKSKLNHLRKKDRTVIGFGMIDQVTSLVLQAPNVEVQAKALDMLSNLAMEWKNASWADDVVIFKALLDALLVVYGSVEQKCLVEAAVTKMQSVDDPALKATFDKWLEQKTVHERLELSVSREEIT